jgi:hypothetical protein
MRPAVNKGAARDPTLSLLLTILAFLAAVLDLRVTARHLPEVQNASADALSHNRLHLSFTHRHHQFQHSPQAPGTGIQPHTLLDLAKLDGTVEQFMDSCIAPSTRSAYKSAQRCYAAFCIWGPHPIPPLRGYPKGRVASSPTSTRSCNAVAHSLLRILWLSPGCRIHNTITRGL